MYINENVTNIVFTHCNANLTIPHVQAYTRQPTMLQLRSNVDAHKRNYSHNRSSTISLACAMRSCGESSDTRIGKNPWRRSENRTQTYRRRASRSCKDWRIFAANATMTTAAITRRARIDTLREHLRYAGRLGGKSRSTRKRASSRANILRALAIRWPNRVQP
jgi:hypothetical protein